eukprot:TRINITY_DN4301_c0_g1_i12.p1 TRINITY_DN4301_c0_g1~~TRINITY_DN4301_c0_g1_i12.p1  ORF type:complete len:376 (+),score=96.60 TRINITY_DN4301_c0_g1_i12:147-1274(+)
MCIRDSPNVLQLLDIHEDEKNLYLVLELAAGGDLFDKIVGDGGFSEETACHYFNQLIDGLQYCHDKKIVHRDLKPENLLLGKEGILKISDFGLSNSLVDMETLLNTHCGSEKYAAPEIMGSSAAYLGPPSDIWSAGVILYIMTAGAFPFTEATARCELYVSLMQGNFQFQPKMTPELKDLLLRMWDIDPRQRITLPEIRQHPWFNLNNPLPQPMELSAMDDELVYRDIAPDVLANDDMAFDQYEEPVYRSIDADATSIDASPLSVSEPVAKPGSLWCTSIKPTAQFVSAATEEELKQRLEEWFMANGATRVRAKEGKLKVELGAAGAKVPLEVVFHISTLGDTTSIAIRRSKGDCLNYIQAYESMIQPAMTACLA